MVSVPAWRLKGGVKLLRHAAPKVVFGCLPDTTVSDARFRRQARLNNKADFRRVFEQPEKSADDCFSVLGRSNQLGFPRLGLAISRKSSKSAVVRNSIRRVIRESFRHHQQKLGGIDVVVIGRKNLKGRGNATLLDSLRKHWLRLVRRCA